MSGSAASIRRAKDGAMAQRMKREGITRNTCRCPACHRIVGLADLPGHVGTLCNSVIRKERQESDRKVA